MNGNLRKVFGSKIQNDWGEFMPRIADLEKTTIDFYLKFNSLQWRLKFINKYKAYEEAWV